MAKTRVERPTVSVASDLYELLTRRAQETGRSVPDLVDEAVRVTLAEDAADEAVLAARADEPTQPLEDLVRELEADGSL